MQFSRIILFLISALFFIGTSCSSQKKLTQKATQAFENGEYVKALELYEKLLETAETKFAQADYQYAIAECYRNLNDSRKAEGAYKKAIKLKKNEKLANYWYAYSLMKNEKYKEALEAFQAYKKTQPKDIRAINGIASCSLAVAWQEKPTRYIVANLKAVNSKQNDFAPLYASSDFTKIYITSSRIEEGIKPSISLVSGVNFTEVYESRIDRKGNWIAATKLQDTTINSPFDDGVMSITSDGFTMYYTVCKQEIGKRMGCQIYAAALKGGAWGEGKNIDIAPDSVSVGHPTVSADGLELYFSSRMKGGLGGADIWKVQRMSESEPWGKPINMGLVINTPGDEMFPFIRVDGNLYFSSDVHKGMGGLDIFRATKDEKGVWSIVNMQYPINSSQDDYGIVFQGKKEIGMFTSDRKGGRGEDDIYTFELPELIIEVKGKLIDGSTKRPIVAGEVTLVGSDGTLQTEETKKDGTYAFKLNQYTDYIVIGSFNGYLKKKVKLSTNNVSDNITFEKNLDLITMSKPIEVPNIFYDSGKWTLNETSKQALEELGKLLEDNPNITIELGAHTDMVGDSLVNLNLSKRRAQSVVEYLEQHGYDPDRLVARGYGENKPVVVTEQLAREDSTFAVGTVLTQEFILRLPKDKQDKANQINRRTELRILTTNYIPKPEYFVRQRKKAVKK